MLLRSWLLTMDSDETIIFSVFQIINLRAGFHSSEDVRIPQNERGGVYKKLSVYRIDFCKKPFLAFGERFSYKKGACRNICRCCSVKGVCG